MNKKGDERLLEQRARFKEYGEAINTEEASRGKTIRLEESRKTEKGYLDQKTKDEDWTATMSAPPKGLLKVKGANYLHLRGEVTVRTLDVAPLIHRIHQRLRRSNPRGGKIFAKFDVRHSLIAGSKSSPASCACPLPKHMEAPHAALRGTLHDTFA